MRRLTAVMLALAVFVPPALAWIPPPSPGDSLWPYDYNTFSHFDISDVPTGDFFNVLDHRPLGVFQNLGPIVPRDSNMRWCGNLRYGTPGHMDPVQPYARLWVYSAADTVAGHRGTQYGIFWRMRAWYPGDYTRIYHTPWELAGIVGYADTLYTFPLISGDSLDSVGWMYDVEFQIAAAPGNDSSLVSLGVMRRTWK